jgi:hypothetical protein
MQILSITSRESCVAPDSWSISLSTSFNLRVSFFFVYEKKVKKQLIKDEKELIGCYLK